MIDVKNYIIESIKSTNPEIDVRKGSSIHDFLIDPLSTVMKPYHAAHTQMLDTLSMADVTQLTTSQMDRLAGNFLQTRLQGYKSSGSVYLLYTEPRALTIPAGTQFAADNGLVFETLYDYSITSAAMSENLSEYPNYVAGPIKVFATAEGSNYNVPIGTTFTPLTRLTSTPSQIICKAAFTDGSDVESNTALFNRLKLELHGSTLASPVAIRNIITTNIPEAVDVEIVGAGNSNMIRDEVKELVDVDRYVKEDYYLVYSGVHDGIYDKKHIAMVGTFMDTDPTNGVAFPPPNYWVTEFSDDMYHGIYNLYDFEYAEANKNVLAYDDFSQYAVPNGQSTLSVIMLSGHWSLNDSLTADNSLDTLNEFNLINGKLRLGKTYNIVNIATPIEDQRVASDNVNIITIPTEKQTVALDDINGAINHLIGDNPSIDSALEILYKIVAASNKNNWSPVIHKQIDQHVGIQIDCEMSTSDSTEDGSMCYITTRRNNSVAIAHDGYGIAWRKQPAYLIRMAYNSYNNNTALRTADITRFNKENIGYNGSDWLGAALLSTEGKKFWKYNVFLVDNDALQQDVWVSSEQIFDQTSGKNQFLQAAKVWIEPNISYNFRLKIFEAYGTLGWVWPSSDTLNLTTHKVISRGQSYPTYEPIGEDSNILEGVYTNPTSRNHFGIGVSQTLNCEWYVNTISVQSILEQFPMFLFKIHTGNFNPLTDLTLNLYGVGYDPILHNYNPNNYAYTGMQVGVYNNTYSRWDIIGSNTSGLPTVSGNTLQFSDICVNKLLTDTAVNYVDSDGYVNIATCAINSGADYPGNTEHAIRAYYVSLDNGQTSTAHRGNCSDIYVYDPANIAIGTSTFTVPENKEIVILGTDVGYIQEILEVREAISGVPFDPTSYAIINNNNGTTFSADTNIKIIFQDPTLGYAQVQVVYKYWTKGDFVSDLIRTSEDRYPNADYMIKVMPPTIVKINKLEYSGGLSLADMKTAIIKFINTEGYLTFDKSDLVNVLYNNGATYVNLDIQIELRSYSTTMVRTITELTAQTYTVPADSITRLFTDTRELAGVIKI